MGPSLSIFFFQAEDGIRDLTVTGVQTCALPICFITPESPQLRCLMSGRDPLNPTGPALGNPISAKYSAGAGQGGWLAYVTHGFYEGTGRRTDRSSWFTMEGYSQASQPPWPAQIGRAHV